MVVVLCLSVFSGGIVSVYLMIKKGRDANETCLFWWMQRRGWDGISRCGCKVGEVKKWCEIVNFVLLIVSISSSVDLILFGVMANRA